jgi:predicted dehydrogenase
VTYKTAVLVGAGNRGMTVYGEYAQRNPDELKFTAIAEPIKSRLEKFSDLHAIPVNRRFSDWKELFMQGKIADIAIICTQDQMHVDPTIQALDLGYHVLLEKPMAHTLKGCIDIVKKVEETGKILGIAHVLRYTKFFSKIKEIIDKGQLGQIINISHRENVSWYHMAHSFVRGNWRNQESSSPMILAKCCHDLDLLYWMMGSNPVRISSFGNLSYFVKENAPEDAPDYCVEGCPIEGTCLYYSPRIYVDILPILQVIEKSENKFYKIIANLRKKHIKLLTSLSKLIPSFKRLRYWEEWPVEPLYSGQPEEKDGDYSDETKMRILNRSPYGRCVFKCDNDVVDHQVVNIEFNNGTTATLTMHGFSEKEGRSLRIDGTIATLKGEFCDSGEKIYLYNHLSGSEELIFAQGLSSDTSQHGGGDFHLIDAFLESIKGSTRTQPLTNARVTLESHLMAFAAEESRLTSKIVFMDDYRTLGKRA